MKFFATAFLVVFALGFSSALAFKGLGTAAGVAAVGVSIVVILLLTAVGDAIATPARGRLGNLMEGAHYQVRGVHHPDGFSDFFRALTGISPPDSYLVLAGGAWDREIRDAITKATANVAESLPPVPDNFHATGNTDEGVIPINESTMEVFAKLADHHASPEIAEHLGAFTSDGTWLEWFDAPEDPITLSLSIPEDAVELFASRIGAKWIACRWTDPH